MKNIVLLSSLILLLMSCTLFSPCVVIVKNQSDYSIRVSNDQNSAVISIAKNKRDHFEVLPGKITVYIETSGITSSRKVMANYLENIEIIYDVK